MPVFLAVTCYRETFFRGMRTSRPRQVGYSRAARLIEIMEANGIVGQSQGSKPREILVRADDYPPASAQTI